MKRLVAGMVGAAGVALCMGMGTAHADTPPPPAFPCIPAPFIVIPGLIPGVHTCAPGEATSVLPQLLPPPPGQAIS